MKMNRFNTEADYSALTSHFPPADERPVIGITGNYGEKGCELADGYFRSIEAAGGLPLIVPPLTDTETLPGLLDRIDGLLLSGGADLNPLYAGEDPLPQLHGINPRRDRCELLLARLAADRNLPLLGICRGIQVIAAALGGRVHQDLAAERPGLPLLKHSQDAPRTEATHRVHAEAGSLMARLLGEDFCVNSFHHQAVDRPGPALRATVHSSDGVVEAVESTAFKPIWGVQWHPECAVTAGDESMLPLFRHLVQEADSYRRARRLHRRILTLDSHCDTPILLARGAELGRRNPDTCVDLHKMAEGALDAAVMVAYLPQGGRTPDELAEATRRADSILAGIREQVGRNPAACIATTPAEARAAKAQGRRAIFLGIENGYAIGRDLTNIGRYRREGVVYITLCHNGDNDLCDSAARSAGEHGGLSAFGRQAVAEMNRQGMMIDLSHASEATFYDVLEASSRPVVCSHSSARALCDHVRNVTDDQLRAIAARGGVVQVTFYDHFLRQGGGATVDDAVAHLLHCLQVAGTDHVGIGTDFDGDGGVPGMSCAADCLAFTRRLMAEGLTEDELARIWGDNFLRVMEEVQQGY